MGVGARADRDLDRYDFAREAAGRLGPALLVEVDGSPCALGQGDALDAVEVTHMRWQTLGELPAVSIWGASPARGA